MEKLRTLLEVTQWQKRNLQLGLTGFQRPALNWGATWSPRRLKRQGQANR